MDKIEQQEMDDCNSYILTHLRFMCEVVFKKYEHLLKTNDCFGSEELGKRIIDLIPLIEENCQAFKQSWEKFHLKDTQNVGVYCDKNQETDNASSIDFYRPMSQIYKNEVHRKGNYDIFQNGIKQEHEETEAILDNSDNNNENAETNNSDSGTHFSRSFSEICVNENTDINSEEDCEGSKSPILSQKVITRKNRRRYSSNKENDVKQIKRQLPLESEELGTDQLIQQLNEVIYSSSRSPSVFSSIQCDDETSFVPQSSSIMEYDKKYAGNIGLYNENNVDISSPIHSVSSSVINNNKNRKNESSTHTIESSINKVKTGTTNNALRKKGIVDIPVPHVPSRRRRTEVYNRRRESIKISKVPVKHKTIVPCLSLPSSNSIKKDYEQDDISDNHDSIDALQSSSLSALIAKPDDENETAFEDEYEEKSEFNDSQETQIYVPESICRDEPETQALRDDTAEEPTGQDDLKRNELHSPDPFEELWQQDTRDGLLELLPPLSQPFYDSSLDNINNHNDTEKDDHSVFIHSQDNTDNLHLHSTQSGPILDDFNSSRSRHVIKKPSEYTEKNDQTSLVDSVEDASLHSRLSSPPLKDANIKSISDVHNDPEEHNSHNLISSQENTRDELSNLLSPLCQPIFSGTRSRSNSTSIHSYTEQEVEDALIELESISNCTQLSPWSTDHSDNGSDSVNDSDSDNDSDLDNDSDSDRSSDSENSLDSEAVLDSKAASDAETDDSLLKIIQADDCCQLSSTNADCSKTENSPSLVDNFCNEDSSMPVDLDLDFHKEKYNIRDCHVVLQKLDQRQISIEKTKENQDSIDEGVQISESDVNDSNSLSDVNIEDDCILSSFASSNGSETEDEEFWGETLSMKNFGSSYNELDIIEFDKNIDSEFPQKQESFKHLNQNLDIESINDKHEDDKGEDDEINRLCRIHSMEKKRRSHNSDEAVETREINETNISSQETIDHETSTDLSVKDCIESSDANFELETNTNNDQFLADIVCNTIKDNDDSYESDVESTREMHKNKKINVQNPNKRLETKLYDHPAHDKDHWRKDPLLTCKLTLNEKPMPKEIILNDCKEKNIINCKNRTKQGSDSKISSDGEMSLDDDMNHKVDNENDNVGKLQLQLSTNEAIQSTQVSEQCSERTTKKCRKNIREVLTYEELTEATKRAEKEEEQRSFRIKQREHMLSSQSNEEAVLILDTTKEGEQIKVDPQLSQKLYPHQRKGVMFMWQSCYESVERLQNFGGLGCILAHCMGLGKTFQVFTLLHTLFAHPITNMKHCLIICPVSTVIPWVKEIEAGLELSQEKIDIIVEYIGGTDNIISKCVKIRRWQERSGILLMGYEAFVHLIFGKSVCKQIEEELYRALLDPGPDLVICDEGHLLKNGKAKRTQAVSKIRTKRRIVLSGTPMQNNLSEYYYMVNFVNSNILGTFKEYDNRFVQPITNGQYGDSTKADIILMKKRSHVLHNLLRNTVQRFEVSELKKYLKPIRNFTIFMQLHPVQVSLYKYFIGLAQKHFTISSGKSTNLFGDMNVAKYICSHPHLLSIMDEQIKLKKNKKDVLLNGEENVLKVGFIEKDWWKALCSETDLLNIDCGPKLKLTLAIIEEAEKLGEKVLIFTSSLIELESLDYFLKKVGTSNGTSWCHKLDYFRMDGSVLPTMRAKMCSHFNNPANKRLRVLLISYKVGGIGLSLTAANRVIILGSVFNPVHDTQSIYRCYRFGQTKTVYVYRLISMGTMEEKIYRRCVSKLALAGRVVDKQQIGRHYDLSENKQLYKDDINLNIPKPLPSKPDDNLLATIISKFDFIHKYVDHQGLLENKPEDDLDDEEKERAWEEFKRECEKQSAQPKLQVPNAEETFTPSLDELLPRNLISNLKTSKNAEQSHISNFNPQTISKSVSSTRKTDDLSHRREDPVLPFSQFMEQEKAYSIGCNKTYLERDIPQVQIMLGLNKLTYPNSHQSISKHQKILSTTNNDGKTFGYHSGDLDKRNLHKNKAIDNPKVMLRENEMAASSNEIIKTKELNLMTETRPNNNPLDRTSFQIKPPLLSKLKRAKCINKVSENSKVIKIIPRNENQSSSSHNNGIQQIAKQIENLTNLTLKPIFRPSAKISLNTKDDQKQMESPNSEIIRDKHNVSIIETAIRNFNKLSTNNSSTIRTNFSQKHNKNQTSSIDIGSNNLASCFNSSLACNVVSTKPGIETGGCHILKPDNAVQITKANTSQHDGIIVQKSEIIGNSNPYIHQKIFKIPKSISKGPCTTKKALKQMHNLNKPQKTLQLPSQTKLHSKKLIPKKKSVPKIDGINYKKNMRNNKERCASQHSLGNSSNATNLSVRHSSQISNTSQKGVKRVYPFSSDDQLKFDAQQSPLDLSKKDRKDVSIKLTNNALTNKHTKNPKKLTLIQLTNKNKKPIPYVYKSIGQSEKQIYKLPKQKLHIVNSKKKNACQSDTSNISKCNPFTNTSKSSDVNQQDLISLIQPMIGSCRILRVSDSP